MKMKMKKINALVLTFILISVLGFNALALEDAPPVQNFEIPRAPAGFEIGDLDLAKWNGALVIDGPIEHLATSRNGR